MKTITVKLPEALASWLSRRARELGRSQSELVREAIEDAKKGAGSTTCHDLFVDACGTVDGPPDLATNKRHFNDFGK